MLFFCSNYAKKYAFCPTLCQIILNFAWLCFAPEVNAHQHSRPEQVPVLQKSISTKRHSNTVVVPVQGQTRSLKEKRKEESCNDKVAGFVLRRNSYALIEGYAHLDSCARPKKCRPCHAHLKLRGGRNVGKYQNGTSYTRVSARHLWTRLVLFGTPWVNAAGEDRRVE